MKFIVDSMVLIYFSRVNIQWLFEKLPFDFVIPERVKQEVVDKGKQVKAPKVKAVNGLIDRKTIEVVKIEDKGFIQDLKNSSNLELGEISCLEVCKRLGGMVISDEKLVRSVADALDIEVHGSFFLLQLAIEQNLLNKKQVREIIDRMIREGWHCSTKLYSHMMKMLRE